MISPTGLNLFVTPKSVPVVLLQLFTDVHRAAKSLSHPMCMFPAEATLRLLVSAHNKCPFLGLFNATVFSFLCFFLVIL